MNNCISCGCFNILFFHFITFLQATVVCIDQQVTTTGDIKVCGDLGYLSV